MNEWTNYIKDYITVHFNERHFALNYPTIYVFPMLFKVTFNAQDIDLSIPLCQENACFYCSQMYLLSEDIDLVSNFNEEEKLSAKLILCCSFFQFYKLISLWYVVMSSFSYVLRLLGQLKGRKQYFQKF